MTDHKHYRIAVVAGEISGDILGAGLIRELARYPATIEFYGIAGPAMQAQGCRSMFPMERLSLMGLDGVFSRIREVLQIRRQIRKDFLASPPDLFIGIDAPDFNLQLEKKLRRAGIPVLHYVSPTVWAWRHYRIKAIRKSVDKMLVLFPFELKYYQQHNVPAAVVGHPMVRDIPRHPDTATMKKMLGLSREKRIIALMPGSRSSEINRLAVDFIQAACLLNKAFPNLQFVVVLPNKLLMQQFRTLSAAYPIDKLDIQYVIEGSRDVMACADIVLLASGTAALEAAIIGRPMVVAYKVSLITKLLVKLFSRVPYYSMPNHLAGYQLVPELLQEDCVPENLCREVARYLESEDEVLAVRAEFARIRDSLDMFADKLAAENVAEMIGLGRPTGVV